MIALKFYRFLTAAILTLLLSFGLPVFAADNALSLDTENSVLDSTKGVRLFSDDFTTKDTQITDFDSVLLNSIAISFPKCDFGNVVPYSGGYVTIGYSDRVDQTLVRFDFNDNGSGFAFSGGTFTAGYHVAVAKGSTAETVTALAERLLYNGSTSDNASVYTYDHSADLAAVIAAADGWVWTENTFTPDIPDAQTLNAYEIALTSKGKQYYDNIELWLYPSNAFFLKRGDTLSMMVANGSSVKLPEDSAWKAPSGKTYAAGATVTLSQIAKSTLTAVDAPEAFNPTLHPTYGVRLAFADFKTKKEEVADFEKGYMKSCDIQIVSCKSGGVSQYGDGYYQIYTDKGAYSDVAFFFNGGSGFSVNGGRITAEYDVAVAKGSNAETCTDIYDRVYYNGTSDTDAVYAEVNHKASLAEVIRVAADWYHETVTFDAIPDATMLNSYHIYFASHYDRQYYDNMAVYYFPKRSYILNIGGTLSLVTDADDVVTLPTGENYVSFLCGDTVYPAGSQVNLSEIEMKTLTASNITHSLDPAEFALSYTFSDDKRGSADGVITLTTGKETLSAEQDSFVLYWAAKNETGVYAPLEGYTPFRLNDVKALLKGVTVDKNLAVPFGAEALLCRVTDPLKSFDVVCEIPEDKRPTGVPSRTFAVISDVHIGFGFGDGKRISPHSNQLATRTELNALAPEFIVVNGDFAQWYGRNVDAEQGGQWEVLTEYFKGFTRPIYFVQGNHEGPNECDQYVNNIIGIDEFTWEHFENFMDTWLAYCRENNYYTVEYTRGVHFYDTEIDGMHFIFCSVPNGNKYEFGEEQLKWLSERLYADEASGKPIFVFDHIPPAHKLNHKDSAYNGGMTDSDAFEAILKEHPTVINISGDTHYTLDTVLANTVGADGEVHYVNDGAIIEEWIAVDETNPNSSWKCKSYDSMGLLIEIYEDRLVLRGRNFVTGKWISEAYTEIRLNAAAAIEKPEACRITEPDGRVTVYCTSNPASVSTVFVTDGAEITTDHITVDAENTKAIAIRQYDRDGGYTSTLYRNIAEIPERKTTIALTENAVSVTAAPADSLLILAAFDASGRYKAAYTCAVTYDAAISFEQSGLVLESGDTVKAFLFGKDSVTPLCEAKEIAVLTE